MNIETGRVRAPRVLRRAGVAVLTFALLTGAVVPGKALADSRVVSEAVAAQDRPDLQEAIQSIVDSGITGVQLRVHDQQGHWVGSAGQRKLGETAKPPADGRFRVGSVTKTFTATLVLQLVAEGKIELDAPAADYLPLSGVDRRITVRMLLQHTSGLFNFTGEYYPDGTVVAGIPWSGKEWVDNRFHTYQPEELVRFALSKPARFAPGTDWSYSNTNYVLARLLIEKVTGSSYAEAMQQRLLRPLGLRGTSAPGTSPAILGPHAHGYYRYQDAGQWKTVDIARQNPSWISSAGDMISTTWDLHTFFSALLGGRLLPAPLLAEMLNPHPASAYGLGVFTLRPDSNCSGTTLINHNGGVQGYATAMYSTLDGSRTLEASLTYVDAVVPPTEALQKALQILLGEVFCDGEASGAEPVRSTGHNIPDPYTLSAGSF